MKKILIGTLALILTAGVAEAQVKENKEHKRHHQMKKGMGFQKLNLTEAQKSQVKTIMEQRRKEMQALKQNDQITVKAWKEQRKAIQEKYHNQLQAVLTPEQKTQLKDMKADKAKAAHFRGGKKQAMKGAALGRMAQQLNLTEAQKQQLKAIRTDFSTKMQAIRSNNSLSQEQKKEQMKALMNQHKQQAKTVLTKEQVEKLETLKKERKNKIS